MYNPHHHLIQETTNLGKRSDYFKGEQVDTGLTPNRRRQSSDPGLEKTLGTLREEAKEKAGAVRRNQTANAISEATEQFYTAEVHIPGDLTAGSTQEILNRPPLASAEEIIERTDRNSMPMG